MYVYLQAVGLLLIQKQMSCPLSPPHFLLKRDLMAHLVRMVKLMLHVSVFLHKDMYYAIHRIVDMHGDGLFALRLAWPLNEVMYVCACASLPLLLVYNGSTTSQLLMQARAPFPVHGCSHQGSGPTIVHLLTLVEVI